MSNTQRYAILLSTGAYYGVLKTEIGKVFSVEGVADNPKCFHLTVRCNYGDGDELCTRSFYEGDEILLLPEGWKPYEKPTTISALIKEQLMNDAKTQGILSPVTKQKRDYTVEVTKDNWKSLVEQGVLKEGKKLKVMNGDTTIYSRVGELEDSDYTGDLAIRFSEGFKRITGGIGWIYFENCRVLIKPEKQK